MTMYQGKGSSNRVKVQQEKLPRISIPEGPNFGKSVRENGGSIPRSNNGVGWGVNPDGPGVKNPQLRGKKPRGMFGDVRGGGGSTKAVKKSNPWDAMPEELREKYSMKSMATSRSPLNEGKPKDKSNRKQNKLLRRYMGGSSNGDEE